MAISAGPGVGAATRQQQDRAYFFDLLGDSHNGLGHPEAAHLALEQPWHAVGYLEACLPLLRDLGLARHANLAQQELDACHVGLAQARLLGEERGGPRSPGPGPSRPARAGVSRPAS